MKNLPKHIAVIPDGNRRWAKSKGLSVIEGHRKGAKVVLQLIEKAKELNIHTLAFWAFSTENWGRMKKEVDALMIILLRGLMANVNKALKNRIRFIHIGRKDRLSTALKKQIEQIERLTKEFTDYYFVLALDYGGRDEILRAFQRISNFKFRISNLNEKSFNQFLDTKDLPYPNPDLVIRTGGEMRTSGFMLWQTEYSEWIFSDKYFPDFTPEDFEECIKEYSRRQRRYGK